MTLRRLALTALMFSCAPRNLIVLNKGVAGNSTSDLVRRVETDVLAFKPDIVILMGGTNDMVNSRKLASYETFGANYQAIIEKLKAQGTSVVMMNILPVDTTYLFQRHDRNAFDQRPNEKIDSANQLVHRIAMDHALLFIDVNRAFKERNSPSHDASSLILNMKNSGKEDGIHPTREGYVLIADMVFRVLKEQRLLKKDCTIVCFGDSITFGAYMDGAGTADGDTYPAFLKRMILRKM
ncbi:MAG: GDSL-type esterase/lipase family protein [Chryseosolibacter sp.]